MGYVPLLLGIEFLLWWLAAFGMVKLANIRFRVVTGRTSGLPNPPCSMPEASAPLRVAAKQSANKPFSRKAQRSAQSLLLATPSTNDKEDPGAYEEFSGPTRSWRLASWFLFFLPLTVGLGWYGYSHLAAERSLEEAIADADRLDPGWRLQELEDKRAV